jgi:hypothetical protein
MSKDLLQKKKKSNWKTLVLLLNTFFPSLSGVSNPFFEIQSSAVFPGIASGKTIRVGL